MAVFVNRVACGPFNSRRLIYHVFNVSERRFCFVLFVCRTVRNGVACFKVSVFCLSTYLYGMNRTLNARVVRLNV